MFAASIFLLALPLVLLPFIIKWIKTGKPKKVIFSQMYLLQKALKSHKELQRRSPILLYIIRMLQICMLIFLIAGLLFKTDALSSSNSALIICDDSFYAQAQNENGEKVWSLQKKEVLNILERLGENAQVAYLGFSGEKLSWANVSQIKKEIIKKEVSYKDEDWQQVRRNLKNLIRERNREKVDVIMVSTSKVTDLPAFKKLFKMLPEGRLKNVIIEEPSLINENLEVKAYLNKDKVNLKGTVSGGKGNKIKLSIESVNGKKVIYQVDRNKEFSISLNSDEFSSGVVRAEIKDRFAFDNDYYYNVDEEDSLKVTMLSFSETVTRLKDIQYYLENGFQTLAHRYPLKFTVKQPSQWRYFDKNSDVLILHDPPFLSNEDWNLFKEYVFEGGQLLLIPGPMTPVDLFTKDMWNILPAELKQRVAVEQGLVLNDQWERNCPRFSKAKLRAKWIFHRLKRSSVSMFKFSDGSPFWVANKYGKGNIHLVSSPFSMYWARTVLFHDYSNVLYTMLDTVKKDWASENLMNLKASYHFPKDILSYKMLMGNDKVDSENNLVKPGLYLCQTKLKNNLSLYCNFDSSNLAKRVEANFDKLSEIKREDFLSEHYSRIDKSIAFILLLLLVLEALVFLKRSRVKV